MSDHDFAKRLTETERDQSFAASEPKDAATLILIDRAGTAPKVLLGKRHHGHKFMPGKFVFPGGRVEAADAQMTATTELNAETDKKLRARVEASAAAPRAFALATLREMAEETGLILGRAMNDAPRTPGGDWDAFAQARVHPDLAALHFVARAITPPNRPKRFDTRFFTADADLIAHRLENVIHPDAELVELVWVPLADAKNLDMPTVTGVVLDELDARVKAGMGHDLPVPFYFMQNGAFVRELL